MMILRSNVHVEIVSVSRSGVDTNIVSREARSGDPEYDALFSEFIALEENDGYEDFIDTPQPLPDSATAPYTFDLSPWEAGTVIRIANEIGEWMDYTDAAASMTLTEPGTYQIQIVPPLPYHSVQHALVLSDA